MWFRNLQIYRLPKDWDMTAGELEKQLERKRFQACGSQDMESRGWLPPTDDGALVRAVGGQWLICLGMEGRLLPASVVRQEAEDRAVQIAEKQGYRPGRKQMKELREDVTRELLPRAFTRRRRTFVWIDPRQGWLAIDAASPARAEEVLETFRQSLDRFPVSLPRTERSPASAMAEWLIDEAPAGFTVDRDCELCSVTEEKAAVRYVRHSLEGDEIKKHLTAGKQPTRLALTFDDRVSFVLTDRLELKRLDFLDVVRDQVDSQEDAEALFDAEFALMTGELSKLVEALIEALGGETE